MTMRAVAILAAVLLTAFGVLANASTASAAAEAEHAADGHADAAHAGGDHGHGPHIGEPTTKPDIAEFRTDLALWTIVVFLLLMAILGKFAWRPIAAGLDKREHGIAENIASAQHSHDEAKAMLAQYESKLAAAHDEVRGLIEEARRDAEHTQQEILAKARVDAGAELDRARREIDTATNQALKQLAEQSTNLAVQLAGKIVKAELKPTDHIALIEAAMSGFGKIDPRQN